MFKFNLIFVTQFLGFFRDFFVIFLSENICLGLFSTDGEKNISTFTKIVVFLYYNLKYNYGHDYCLRLWFSIHSVDCA